MTSTRATAITVLLFLVVLVTAPGMAAGAPSSAPRTTDPDGVSAVVSVNGVKPTVVTTATGPTVVVAGTVRNTGHRTLHTPLVRVQRGQPARRAADLRSELAADPATFEINGEFRQIADALAPGASAGFSLTMPLHGPGGLRITEPGVYPLLVNLNATPDDGGQARVADSRTLLPVLSLPADRDRARSYAADPSLASTGLGPDGSIAANTRDPARFAMLWPIAAPPQAVPGRIGAGATDTIVLVNENLARSMSPGGRLHNLLDGLRPVISAPADDPRAVFRRSLCLAVDPDLLVTVTAMTHGYSTLADARNRSGATKPGTGQAQASAWLADLKKLAAKQCVVALPYAGADADALHRVGNTGLTRLAFDGGADLVDSLLGVASIRGLAIPAAGTLTADGADELGKADLTTALVGSDTVAPRGRSAASGQYSIAGNHLATFDRPIGAALGAAGSRPTTGPLTPETQAVDLRDESPVSRRQAALASLAFPAIAVPDPRFPARPGDPLPVAGRSSLIVPPVYWSITPADAVDLAATAALLLQSGAATPTPIPGVIAETGRATAPASLVAPPGTETADGESPWWLPSATAAASINGSANLSWQLQSALVTPAAGASPDRYMSPLRYDLLRGLPAPVQAVAPTVARGARAAHVTAVSDALAQMRKSVTILDPGGKYTQVSERSPLLLVTRNELALPIRVKIDTTAPNDFDIGDVGVIEVPARGTRQVQFPAQSKSSEATSVRFTLVSASGVQLGGEPIMLSVNSNAYGKPLFVVTLVAAGILVLLVARRLWHRFRGTPDPADADRPEASPQDRFLAGRDYSWRHGEATPPNPTGDTDD